MKMISNALSKFVALFFSLLLSFIAVAQEKSVDININKNSGGGSNWYTNPIVWVIGGAVFILLLVALLRGNNSRN